MKEKEKIEKIETKKKKYKPWPGEHLLDLPFAIVLVLCWIYVFYNLFLSSINLG